MQSTCQFNSDSNERKYNEFSDNLFNVAINQNYEMFKSGMPYGINVAFEQ